jgi:multidrug efflux pump subunit AcrA (membrane-fusion protein)
MSEAPAPQPGGGAGRSLQVGALLVVVTIAIAAATLWRGGAERGEAVRVGEVKRQGVTQKVLAQGKVRARTQVEVASEIGGRISVVNVKVGDVVKEGDPLFSLDDEQLKNAVEQLRVGLLASEAMVKRARLGLQEADRGVERDRNLREKGVVADEQLRLSESRAELARAELEQAQAGVERTRLDLQRARDALRRARVAAPTAGTIVAVGVEVGQVVSAVQGLTGGDGLSSLGLGASASGPMAPVVIADLAELIVKLDVDELDVGLVKEGQRAVVRAQGLKDLAFTGTVERVGLMGRDQAGAVLFVVEVGVVATVRDERAPSPPLVDGAPPESELPAPRDIMRPGMSAQAEIEVQHLEGVIVVPVAAVLEGDGGARADRVFVYEGDEAGGVVREQQVKLGPTEGDLIAILSGLTEEQRVVEGPFRTLRALADGDRVTLEHKGEARGERGARERDRP